MGREIERKFLVVDDAWRADVASAVDLRQGYLCVDPQRTVRVRVAADRAWLTLKGRAHGATRAEFEYPIPLADARQLLDLCLPGAIAKTRHRVDVAGRTWEVDVFEGDNSGLVLAEVELDDAGATVVLPSWVGTEVTEDPRYANANLAVRPYSRW